MCKEADEIFAKAKKTFHKKFLFGSKAKNYIKAADLFDCAAEAYKRVHLYEECGHAYLAKAESLMKANKNNDALEAYSDAADAYEGMASFEKVNVERISNCLDIASRIEFEQGFPQRAAKIQKDLGERLMVHKGDKEALEAATQAFFKAADYFAIENAFALANDCYEKAATALGYKEDWHNASKAWQKILYASHNQQKQSSGTRSMVHFKANKYIFRSILCELAGLGKDCQERDLEIIENELEELTEQFGQNFEKNREYDLLCLLIQLLRERDLKRLNKTIERAPSIIQEDEYSKFLLDSISEKLESICKFVGDLDLT